MPEKISHKVYIYPETEKKIARESPSNTEDLPLPVVRYPDHYGTFIAFSELESSEYFFCECERNPILNYFKLEKIWTENEIVNPGSWNHHRFPEAITQRLKEPVLFGDVFKFKPSLCHRCNLKVPQMRYCHEMYGRRIKQYFGWYFKQDQMRLAVVFPDYLPGITPKDLARLCRRFVNFETGLEKGDEGYSRNYYSKEIQYFQNKKIVEKILADYTRNSLGIFL